MHLGMTYSMTIGHTIDYFQKSYIMSYKLDQFSLHLLTLLIDTMVYTQHMLV